MALVLCPSCNTQLDVPDDFIGKKVRCATCETVFEANVAAVPPSVPPPLPTRDNPSPTGSRRDWGSEGHHDDEADDASWHGAVPHRGGLILGLGIGSLIGGAIEFGLGACCCSAPLVSIPLGVVGWILGHGDLKQMDAGRMDPSGRSNTHSGYVCGMIGCCLGIMGLLCVGVKLLSGRHW